MWISRHAIKVLRYPADPPTVEEIIAVMHAAGDDAEGLRLRGLIIVLWRAGLRIREALALAETDLEPARGALVVRSGLCRIRHKPVYAESRVMPSKGKGRDVFPAQCDSGCQATRHNRTRLFGALWRHDRRSTDAPGTGALGVDEGLGPRDPYPAGVSSPRRPATRVAL